jgi:antirestriction protein
MTEKPSFVETMESKVAIVGKWMENIVTKQEVNEIPREILVDVLEHCGANFEGLDKEARECLKGYSEKEKGPGVRAVWGDEFVDGYKSWTKEFIDEYESNLDNKKLPELKPSGRKNSGMIQFLFDLTSFASGECSFETFKTYTEGRVKNGQAWAEDRKDDRIRVKVPTSTELILLSSVPPEFPTKAWEWLSTKK